MADEVEPFKPDFKRTTVGFNEHLNEALLSKQAALKQKKRKSCSNISSGTRGDSDVDCGDPDGLPPLPRGVSIHCNIPSGTNGVIFIGNLWKILNISSDLEATVETFIPPCHSCPNDVNCNRTPSVALMSAAVQGAKCSACVDELRMRFVAFQNVGAINRRSVIDGVD